MCHHIERLTVLGVFLVIEGQMAAVAVDNLRGRIYWSDHSKNTIIRAALDGSNQTVIVNAGEFFNAIPRRTMYKYGII